MFSLCSIDKQPEFRALLKNIQGTVPAKRKIAKFFMSKRMIVLKTILSINIFKRGETSVHKKPKNVLRYFNVRFCSIKSDNTCLKCGYVHTKENE